MLSWQIQLPFYWHDGTDVTQRGSDNLFICTHCNVLAACLLMSVTKQSF